MIARGYVTAYHERRRARDRRAENALLGHCINENARLTHGPATHGVRCSACHDTHRRTS